MPLYKVDQDILNMIKYALAVYKFRNYLSGFGHLSAYLVGLCFERIIVLTGTKFSELNEKTKRGKDLMVPEVIRFLKRHGQINSEEERVLRNCWNFRSRVMHKGSNMRGDELTRQTKRVLRKICTMVEMNFEEHLANIEFENILKFGERELKKGPFKMITDSDFDEFMSLYAKCSALQMEIDRNLDLPLHPEELSEFVPTTGGIWLPWVTHRIPTKRAHISRATLGLTFTPSNVRIGLDFGSKAHFFKKQYYRLLLERKLGVELRKLESSNREYSFFDTVWYYHIRRPQPIEWYFDPNKKHAWIKRIKAAQIKILNQKPMTGNDLLIGKIVGRDSEEFPRLLERLPEEAINIFHEIYPILAKIESER